MHVLCYLKFKIPFFEAFEKDILQVLLERLLVEVYEVGDKIIRKGEIGDRMFIIFEGEVGVYLTPEVRIATLGKNKIFGERALQMQEERNADVICEKKAIIFTLLKNDYRETVYHLSVI